MRPLNVHYRQDFLTHKEADYWLSWLQNSSEISWEQEFFNIFGRSVAVPRQLAWFGDSGLNYRYTGLDHEATGWPKALIDLKARVEALASQDFNFLLLNRYRNGRDHMGWHRDDEAGCNGKIASLSLGAVRRFRIEREPSCQRQHIDLEHGSLTIFDGQQRHCLTKTSRAVSERINLTFRLIQH